MEDSYYHNHRVDVERTDWPTTTELEEKRTSVPLEAGSEGVCKSPYAAESGNSFGGEPCPNASAGGDKEKREQ